MIGRGTSEHPSQTSPNHQSSQLFETNRTEIKRSFLFFDIVIKRPNFHSVPQQASHQSPHTNSTMLPFQSSKGAVVPAPPQVNYEIFQKEELFSVPITTTRTCPPVIAVNGTSFWRGSKAPNDSQDAMKVMTSSNNSSSILATTSSPHRIRVMRRPVEVIGGTLQQPEQCRGPPFYRA